METQSGTNDFHGKMDWAYQSFAAMKAPWRAAFTPLYNHHVAQEEGADLPLSATLMGTLGFELGTLVVSDFFSPKLSASAPNEIPA